MTIAYGASLADQAFIVERWAAGRLLSTLLDRARRHRSVSEGRFAGRFVPAMTADA